MSTGKDDMPEREMSRVATWEAHKYYFEKVLIHQPADTVVLFKNNLALKTFVVDELTSDQIFALFRYALLHGGGGAAIALDTLAETYANIKENEND